MIYTASRDGFTTHLHFGVVSVVERSHKSDFHVVIARRYLKVIADDPLSIGIIFVSIAHRNIVLANIRLIAPIRVAPVSNV